MKLKLTGFAFLTVLFVLIGCDDSTGNIGIDLMPDSDAVYTYTASFEAQSESIEADSVYARSETGYLGRYTDPEFGYYEASFLTELNCTENYKFPAVYSYDEATGTASGTMAGDSCTNIRLVVYYTTWFGDSLTASRLSAYRLNDRWLQERKGNGRFYRYTNIDTDKYYDAEEGYLGSKAYTAHDFSVSDEERKSTDSNGYATYYPNVSIQLDRQMGQDILELNRKHPEYFKNADTFIENVFPGVYIKNDYGDGTILYVDYVALQMQFRYHYTDSLGVALKKQVTDSLGVAGEDSLYYSSRIVFASSSEIIQANRFQNSAQLQAKIAEDNHTYIKSPAGIFTAVTLPYDEIDAQLGNDTLNAIKLSFTNYEQESEYEYSMDEPATLLLIRKKDLKDFFEQNELPDNATTYTATHNASATNKYVFSNIARLVTTSLQEKHRAKAAAGSAWDDSMEQQWTEDNKLLLVPVVLSTYTNSSSGTTTTTGVQHDLEPSYTKLVGGTATEGGKLKNPITIDVTYTRFTKDK